MKKRVIVITGTRKGLGRELASHYLETGDIVVGCSRKESDLDHQNYRHFMLDVADEKSVVSMVRAVRKEFGHVDVLLNNAGIASMNHILTSPGHTARSVFDTNFFGTFLFTREIAKIMVRNKQGSIVNYSTVAVPLRLSGEAVYAASKAAVETFTRITSRELADFGIRINTVGPSPIQTDLISAVPADKINDILSQQSIHELGTSEDLINVVDFFISDASRQITGQTIYLGGLN